MAAPLRHSAPEAIAAALRTFFVTSSIAEKRNLLQSHRSAKLFIDVLYHYRRERKYLLHDFVVMPDHFHVLITVEREMRISRGERVRLQSAGRGFELDEVPQGLKPHVSLRLVGTPEGVP